MKLIKFQRNVRFFDEKVNKLKKILMLLTKKKKF